MSLNRIARLRYSLNSFDEIVNSCILNRNEHGSYRAPKTKVFEARINFADAGHLNVSMDPNWYKLSLCCRDFIVVVCVNKPIVVHFNAPSDSIDVESTHVKVMLSVPCGDFLKCYILSDIYGQCTIVRYARWTSNLVYLHRISSTNELYPTEINRADRYIIFSSLLTQPMKYAFLCLLSYNVLPFVYTSNSVESEMGPSLTLSFVRAVKANIYSNNLLGYAPGEDWTICMPTRIINGQPTLRYTERINNVLSSRYGYFVNVDRADDFCPQLLPATNVNVLPVYDDQLDWAPMDISTTSFYDGDTLIMHVSEVAVTPLTPLPQDEDFVYSTEYHEFEVKLYCRKVVREGENRKLSPTREIIVPFNVFMRHFYRELVFKMQCHIRRSDVDLEADDMRRLVNTFNSCVSDRNKVFVRTVGLSLGSDRPTIFEANFIEGYILDEESVSDDATDDGTDSDYERDEDVNHPLYGRDDNMHRMLRYESVFTRNREDYLDRERARRNMELNDFDLTTEELTSTRTIHSRDSMDWHILSFLNNRAERLNNTDTEPQVVGDDSSFVSTNPPLSDD